MNFGCISAVLVATLGALLVSQIDGRMLQGELQSALNKEPSSGLGLLKSKRRMMFDSSCKGMFDRDLFGQLERVCEDCYNLYRQPHVATECRRDCFTTQSFEGCLHDLMMHEYVGEYKGMVELVAGRK